MRRYHGRAGGGGGYGCSAAGLPAAGRGKSPDGARFIATATVSASPETTMPPALQRNDGPPANQPTPKPTTPKPKPNTLIGIAKSGKRNNSRPIRPTTTDVMPRPTSGLSARARRRSHGSRPGGVSRTASLMERLPNTVRDYADPSPSAKRGHGPGPRSALGLGLLPIQ